jgi:hypothetical protein
VPGSERGIGQIPLRLMKWVFPDNNGGQESGFHDPGVETFKGNFDRFLARESIQNSIDAAASASSPVRVKFLRSVVRKLDVPGAIELLARLEACEKYWRGDPKPKAFFKNAHGLLSSNEVPLLRISDYSTTGVTGGDSEQKGNWYNLVRCSGSSFKGGGEGGSFGIGKNAPFAASALRTVFYSTLNSGKEAIFQGVARLVTHENPVRKGKAQAIGYWGESDGSSVRTVKDIPAELRRKERGTDILIYGYLGGENWRRDIIYSVLENFWPSIHFGQLLVQVEDVEINKKTLPSLLKEYANEPDFTALFYYNAVTSDSARFFEGNLATLGKVKLWLLVGDSRYPNKVAMTRRSGMIVLCRTFRSILRFSGFFQCTDEKGNNRLRDMEPPAHNAWDPDRPEKGVNRPVERELQDYIRSCVQELSPPLETETIVIPDLYRYLPDDGDAEDTAPFGTGVPEQQNTLNESASTPPRQAVKARPLRPKAVRGDPNDDKEDEDGTGGPQDENGEDKGAVRETGKRKRGEQPGEAEADEKKALNIAFRTYLQNGDGGTYAIAIKPREDCKEAKVRIRAVGDDSRAESVDISEAFLLPARTPLTVASPNVIKNVAFLAGTYVMLEVKLKDKQRMALDVSAYEI